MSPKPSRGREAARDVLEPRVLGGEGVGAGRNEGFYARVYAVVSMVPAGRVTTYGDVGTILGSPRVARQVGWALAALPPDTRVPWQRVINAHGTVSWRGELARAALQEALLRAEGVAIDERGRLDLPALRWHYPGVIVPYRGDTASTSS
ncbi:MAG: MGMT family protein [Deltaproteobacteria bacterium]|nr:MGMT family protein [Deltaproteobacteria bacterium]